MKKWAMAFLVLAGCYDYREESRRDDPFERFERLPVGAGNVKITVEQFEFETEDRAAFDAAFAYRDRNVAVAGGGIYAANGMTVFAGTRNFVAAFRSASEKYRSREYRKFFQIVADGYEAELHVVERVPMPVTHVIPIYSGAVVIRTLEVMAVGTSLLVKPKKTGSLVDLEVTPVVSDRKAGAIRVTELTTRLLVEPGRPYVILSTDERKESFGGTFFARRASSTTRRVMQVLTVEAP